MPINPYDKPAELQLIDTYIPLPFEDFMRAGASMQNKWDKASAAMGEWEADALKKDPTLIRDIPRYNELRNAARKKMGDIRLTEDITKPESLRKFSQAVEEYKSNPELQAIIAAPEIHKEWSGHLAAEGDNADYNTEPYKRLELLWGQYGTPVFAKIIGTPEGRTWIKEKYGFDTEDLGITNMDSFRNATPTKFVAFNPIYNSMLAGLHSDAEFNEWLTSNKTLQKSYGWERVGMEKALAAFGIVDVTDYKKNPKAPPDYQIIDGSAYSRFLQSAGKGFTHRAEYDLNNIKNNPEFIKNNPEFGQITPEEFQEQQYIGEAVGVARNYIWEHTKSGEDITEEYGRLQAKKEEKTTTFPTIPYDGTEKNKSAEEIHDEKIELDKLKNDVLANAGKILSDLGAITKVNMIDLANAISNKKWYSYLMKIIDPLLSDPSKLNPSDYTALVGLKNNIVQVQIDDWNTDIKATGIAKQYIEGDHNAYADWWKSISALNQYSTSANVTDEYVKVNIKKIVDKANSGVSMDPYTTEAFMALRQEGVITGSPKANKVNMDVLDAKLVSQYASEFKEGKNKKLNKWYDEDPDARGTIPTTWMTAANTASFGSHALTQITQLALTQPTAFFQKDGKTPLTPEDLKMVSAAYVTNEDGTITYNNVRWSIGYQGGKNNKGATVVYNPIQNLKGEPLPSPVTVVCKDTRIGDYVIESFANSQEDALNAVANSIVSGYKTPDGLTQSQRTSVYNTSITACEIKYDIDKQTVKSSDKKNPYDITSRLRMYADEGKTGEKQYILIALDENNNWRTVLNAMTGEERFGSIEDAQATLGLNLQFRSIGAIQTTTTRGITTQ